MGIKQYSPRSKTSATGRTFNARKDIDRMYDKKWGHYRIRFLAVNKQCYACGKSSEVVDHLVPHKGCPVLFKDLHNHIPLCARCHNTVTTKFDRNFKKGDSMTPKIKWFVEERLFNEVDVRVKVLPEY